MTDKQRLEVIEGLCLCYDGDKDVRRLQAFAEMVYAVSHTASSCHHKDWDKDVEMIRKTLIKNGIIGGKK